MVSVFVALFTMLFIFGFAGVSNVSAKECSLQETPLPKDLNIEPLADSVPPALAQFHGIWSKGAWGDGALCNTLVVTVIDNDGNAKIVYSIGGANDPSPKFWEKDVKIRNGKLKFWLGRGARLEYKIGKGGTIQGVYDHPRSGRWKVTLTKIEAP